MSKTGTNATIPPCVADATHDEINTLTVRNLTDDQLIAQTKEQLQKTKTSHGDFRRDMAGLLICGQEIVDRFKDQYTAEEKRLGKPTVREAFALVGEMTYDLFRCWKSRYGYNVFPDHVKPLKLTVGEEVKVSPVAKLKSMAEMVSRPEPRPLDPEDLCPVCHEDVLNCNHPLPERPLSFSAKPLPTPSPSSAAPLPNKRISPICECGEPIAEEMDGWGKCAACVLGDAHEPTRAVFEVEEDLG